MYAANDTDGNKENLLEGRGVQEGAKVNVGT